MVCSPNPNRGEGRFHLIGVFIDIPDVAGNGAKTSLDQRHGGSIGCSRGGVIGVFRDLKGGICFKTDNGRVHQSNLRKPIGASGNSIANENVIPTRQGTGACRTDGIDNPVDPDDPTGRLFVGGMQNGVVQRQAKCEKPHIEKCRITFL